MASFQRRGKNSFLLVVEAGYNSKGNRIRKTKTIRIEDEKLLKTKKRLNDYLELELAKFKIEVESGEYISPEKMTVIDFVQDWEKKYAVKHLSEGTLEVYKSHLKNHILPALGHMKLDQVKPIHIVNFMDDLQRKDGREKAISMSTTAYIYRVIRNVFERATEWKIIKFNPIKTVSKPKENSNSDVNVYTEKEVEILFKFVQEEAFHWRVFLSLALSAGLRRGELLGLEWQHIDLEKGTIYIKQVISRGEKGRAVLKEPKTKKSKRVISLPHSVLVELKKFNLHWKKEKMKMRENWIENKHEFLFCKEDGTHFYPTTPTTWWRRFVNRVGIRYIRLHDLRHTSATLLINQGVHAKIISERLGHSNIKITMDTYGHALQSADMEAAQKLDSIFSRKTSN